MNDATADDQSLIQSTFEDAADAVGDMVTNALHKGLALGDLGVVIERAFDGQVVTGCAMRTDIARRANSFDRERTHCPSPAAGAVSGSNELAEPNALTRPIWRVCAAVAMHNAPRRSALLPAPARHPASARLRRAGVCTTGASSAAS